MSKRAANLQRLLYPRHIACIGGNDAALSAAQCAKQFDGPVWAVNPKRDELGGLPCFASVDELPEAPDAVFLATPRAATLDTLRRLNARGAGGAAVFTAGYGELGADGRAAERELVTAAGDMALVGPNCYGLINYTNGTILWPFGAGEVRCDRGIALVMQSGMIPANLTMNERSVPITHVISAGNQAALAIEDYVELLAGDERVTAIGLYIEGIRDLERFSSAAAKAFDAGKPVVVLKAGASQLAEHLSITHTGSLSGSDAAFRALFDRLGILRVDAPAEMMETLKFLSVSGAPRGRRVAAFTCSGGEAALLADYCAGAGLELPQPSPAAREQLAALLPDIATVSNPLDYTTPLWGNREVMPRVYATLMADGFDAAVTIQDYPPSHIHSDNSLYRNDGLSFVDACRKTGLPGASCCTLPENIDAETRQLLIDGGVTPLQGFDTGLDALANACRYGAMRAAVQGQDRAFRPLPSPPADTARRVLDEYAGKRRLADVGVAVPTGMRLARADLPLREIKLDYPLALKLLSAELPHKSDVGAVRLDLDSRAAVDDAIAGIDAAVARAAPAIDRDAFLLETMIGDVIAELIVGVRGDPQFGPVLVIASGGLLVDLVGDAQTLLLPTDTTAILEALQKLRSWPLLRGYRGGPTADIVTLVATIADIAQYAVDNSACLLELDVNPLMVTPGTAIAADVLIVEAET